MRTMETFRSNLVAAYPLPNASLGLFDAGASFDAAWDVALPRRTRQVRARRQIGGAVISFPDTRTADPVPILFSLLPREQAQMVMARVHEIAKVYGPQFAVGVLSGVVTTLITYFLLGLR